MQRRFGGHFFWMQGASWFAAVAILAIATSIAQEPEKTTEPPKTTEPAAFEVVLLSLKGD